MAQKSLEFARQTYCMINNAISANIKGSIAIAAEEHYDDPDPDYMEPALQAVYLHIGLLEVLRYRFGEDHTKKIQLGVELTESALNFITTSIEGADGEIPDKLKGFPMVYAVQHAMHMGIDIRAIDTYADYNGELIGPSADMREQLIQENIRDIGLKNRDGFTMIIRGANHLSNDQGISNEKIIASGGDIKMNPCQFPYKKNYNQVYYFNAAHLNTEQLKGDTPEKKIIAAESRYYTAETNALQISAPKGLHLSGADIAADAIEAARQIERQKTDRDGNRSATNNNNPLKCAISGYTPVEQLAILQHIQNAAELQSHLDSEKTQHKHIALL